MRKLMQGPGQGGSGSFVAGEEEGDQLVAELGVGEDIAVVARAKESRDQVSALSRQLDQRERTAPPSVRAVASR